MLLLLLLTCFNFHGGCAALRIVGCYCFCCCVGCSESTLSEEERQKVHFNKQAVRECGKVAAGFPADADSLRSRQEALEGLSFSGLTI